MELPTRVNAMKNIIFLLMVAICLNAAENNHQIKPKNSKQENEQEIILYEHIFSLPRELREIILMTVPISYIPSIKKFYTVSSKESHKKATKKRELIGPNLLGFAIKCQPFNKKKIDIIKVLMLNQYKTHRELRNKLRLISDKDAFNKEIAYIYHFQSNIEEEFCGCLHPTLPKWIIVQENNKQQRCHLIEHERDEETRTTSGSLINFEPCNFSILQYDRVNPDIVYAMNNRRLKEASFIMLDLSRSRFDLIRSKFNLSKNHYEEIISNSFFKEYDTNDDDCHSIYAHTINQSALYPQLCLINAQSRNPKNDKTFFINLAEKKVIEVFEERIQFTEKNILLDNSFLSPHKERPWRILLLRNNIENGHVNEKVTIEKK